MKTTTAAKRFCCQMCRQSFPPAGVIPASMLHGTLVEKLCAGRPDWSETGYICLQDLHNIRHEYLEENLSAERSDLTTLQKDVLQSIQENESLVKNLNTEFDNKLSFGQRIADKVASFGGSWTFIIIFISVLLVWMIINSIALIMPHPFDAYPYMLLNLVLSCVAAIQAPVIMMSQNRQEEKDRIRSEQDFRTNLKAELEIRTLHIKIDELISHQWQRLLEIQQLQTEMMEEMMQHRHPQHGVTEQAGAGENVEA